MNLRQLAESIDIEVQKPIKLLERAKNILTNQIGHCLVNHCSVEEPCTSCLQCKSLYDKIDKYLKEQ